MSLLGNQCFSLNGNLLLSEVKDKLSTSSYRTFTSEGLYQYRKCVKELCLLKGMLKMEKDALSNAYYAALDAALAALFWFLFALCMSVSRWGRSE